MTPATRPVAPEPAPTPTPERGGPRRWRSAGLVAALALVGGVGTLLVLGNGDDTEGVVAAQELPSSDPAPKPTSMPAPTTLATTTTVAPATTEAPTTTTTPSTTELGPAAFPLLADGSPAPIMAVLDGPTVALSGWVPSAADAELLERLVAASSVDTETEVVSNLQVDSRVPREIGIRINDLNSALFSSQSTTIMPRHAAHLDRIATTLDAHQEATVVVVGHTDPLGNQATNQALSEARAESVVAYLVAQGIDPSRLSARAMGEQDLLSNDRSQAALAQNRRTELILYGVLAD